MNTICKVKKRKNKEYLPFFMVKFSIRKGLMSEFWMITIICIAIAFFIVFISSILRILFPGKNYDIKLGFSIIGLSIIAILCSIFLVGGWTGMGIGFISALVLGGTLVAMIINAIIKTFLRNEDKTNTY
jgi:hypothetical protein